MRAIRKGLADVRTELQDLKLRMGSVEEGLTLVERGVVNLHSDIAIGHNRPDRLNDRIGRIERRLDIVEND